MHKHSGFMLTSRLLPCGPPDTHGLSLNESFNLALEGVNLFILGVDPFVGLSNSDHVLVNQSLVTFLSSDTFYALSI
jgi:hypothetical protein